MVRYEDRILQQKQALQAELSETAARIDQAKSLVEQKFDQKRKAFKEAEIAYQKRFTETERERALLSQQLQNETKVRETLSKRLEGEQSKLKESVQQLTDTIATEREAHHSEVDRIRSQLADLEKVYHEAVATQEREKALFEGKVVFLE